MNRHKYYIAGVSSIVSDLSFQPHRDLCAPGFVTSQFEFVSFKYYIGTGMRYGAELKFI